MGRRRASSGRRLGRLWIALAVAAALVAATSSSGGAFQDPPDQLSIGQWSGGAAAMGVTQASAQGGLVIITGTFNANLDFVVSDQGAITGRWDLRGQTSWRLIFNNGSGSAFLTHNANGEMNGDRSRVGLGRPAIVNAGSVSLPVVGTVSVASTDTLAPLDLDVVALFCDDVYGEWILSWNTQLSDASLSPTFQGNWQARRLAGDGPSAERTLQLMPELFDLRERLINTWADAEMLEGVPVLPIGTITGLLSESVTVVNQLNNLSTCDIDYLGADNVQQWMYSFTTAVSLLNQALIAAVDQVAQGAVYSQPIIPFESDGLLRWATILAASGAVGPGSLDPTSSATLASLTAAVEGARGEATSEAARTTAAALADQLGLGPE